VHHEPSQQTSSYSRNLQAKPHNLLHQTLEAGNLPQSAAAAAWAAAPPSPSALTGPARFSRISLSSSAGR